MKSMGRLYSLIFHVVLLSLASAQALYPDEICVQGCFEALSGIEFSGTDSAVDGYYVDKCSNTLRIQSVYLCSREHCSQPELEAGIKYYNDFCEFEAGIMVPDLHFIANYSPDSVSKIPVVEPSQVNVSNFLTSAVLPSDDLFNLGYETVNSWNSELRLHVIYGWALYCFWATVISLGVSCQLWTILTRVMDKSPTHDIETLQTGSSCLKPTPFQSATGWVRQNLIIPAAFGYRCKQPLYGCGTLPPRLQTITIGAFVLMNLILCCVSYHTFENSMYFSNYRTQIWRMVSDRAGILAFANLPLLWLFSSRNNFLLWLTGWSYETFSQFHRWVARVTTLEAVIHSIGYTATTFFDGGNAEYIGDWALAYWYWGAVATIIMCLICIFSVYNFRTRFYETFLYLHIVFAALTLIGCFYHVSIFNGVYIDYLWPCVVIWVFDRCMRVLRLGLVNHFSFTKAHATYNPQADIISLDVWPSNLTVYPRKGSYYFLYILNNIRAYENHPFTLATWECGDNSSQNLVFESSGAGVSTKKREFKTGDGTQIESMVIQTSKTDSIINHQEHAHPRLSFLIRPRSGFTARLREAILGSTSSCGDGRFSKDLKVFIEGPYGGSSLHFETFERMLIVVGGSGISLGFSYLQELCHNQGSSITPRSHHDPSIHFIWAVPKISSIMDILISAKLQHFASSLDRFSMDVFVTKEMDMDIVRTGDTKTTPDVPFQTIAEFEFPIQFHNHRPDLMSTVLEYAQSTATGKMGVVSCGPPQMADDCRRAVVQALQEGYANIELVEESFGW